MLWTTQLKTKISHELIIKRGMIEKEVINASASSDILILGWAGWQAADFYFSTHPTSGQSCFKFPVSRVIKMGTCVGNIVQSFKIPVFILHGQISDACMLGIFFDTNEASKGNLIYSLRIFDYLFSYCKKGKEFSGIEVFITDKTFASCAKKLLKLRPNIKSKVTLLDTNNLYSDLLYHTKDEKINLLSLSKNSSLVASNNLRIFDCVAASLLITV